MIGAATRVWAPHAREVDVVLDDGTRHALARADDGWYAGPALPDGTRYRLSLDGGDPLPDPRSRRQPDGPEGVSCVVDHARFEWRDAGWRGVHLPSAVIYELHVGTFTVDGTFDGAVERLDHLVDLGVDVVEVMPVATFPGRRGWGYDGVDLYAPLEAYGGPDGFKRFVDACHRRGLGVLLDVVFNHLGPAGNHLPRFGPYFTDRYRTPWGDALNYDDAGSDEVRRFVVDCALEWLEHYHLDGLRLDAVHAIFDTSPRHVLEELADDVRRLEDRVGRRLWLVAESDANDPRLVRDPAVGGYGLDAVWADDLHHAVHTALTGEDVGYYADYGSLATLARALERGFAYQGDRSGVRGRRVGRAPGDLAGSRFVVCSQNHDQVGNRAVGDRLVHLVGPGRAKLAALIVLTSPYVPLLFQGEEWGASSPFQYFTDHADPELAAAVSKGRREEFQAVAGAAEVPDPQDPATFERSRLDWSERDRAPHTELLSWYRALLALRRTEPGLGTGRAGETHVSFDEERRWLVIERADRVAVVVNLGEAGVDVPLRRPGAVVLATDEGAVEVDGTRAHVRGGAGAVIRLDAG